MDTTVRHDVLVALDELDERRVETLKRFGRGEAEIQREVNGLGYRGHGVTAVREVIAQRHGVSMNKAREILDVAEAQGVVMILGNGTARRVYDGDRRRALDAEREARAQQKADAIARINEVLPQGPNGIAAVTVAYNGYLSIDTASLERIADAVERAS